jgi:hypothetical protein
MATQNNNSQNVAFIKKVFYIFFLKSNFIHYTLLQGRMLKEMSFFFPESISIYLINREFSTNF